MWNENHKISIIKLNFQNPNGNLKWDKVFKNGPSKISERHPLKNFTWSFLEYFVPNVNSTLGLFVVGVDQ